MSVNDEQEPLGSSQDRGDERWILIRDLVQFQLKLILDGVRDLLLLPVSLVAGLGGLILNPSEPDRYFRAVMGAGRRTERWINLFGQQADHDEDASIDQLFEQIESRLKQQANKGGLTDTARQSVERSVNLLQSLAGSFRKGSSDRQ